MTDPSIAAREQYLRAISRLNEQHRAGRMTILDYAWIERLATQVVALTPEPMPRRFTRRMTLFGKHERLIWRRS